MSSVAAAQIGMAYGYFGLTPIPADDVYHTINVKEGSGGFYGNGDLFEPGVVQGGLQMAQSAIVSIMIWAEVDAPAVTEMILAIQLDKQKGAVDPSLVLIRVPVGIIWSKGCAVYNGILLAGDIIRGAAMAPGGSGAFDIKDGGYATVLAVPVTIST